MTGFRVIFCWFMVWFWTTFLWRSWKLNLHVYKLHKSTNKCKSQVLILKWKSKTKSYFDFLISNSYKVDRQCTWYCRVIYFHRWHMLQLLPWSVSRPYLLRSIVFFYRYDPFFPCFFLFHKLKSTISAFLGCFWKEVARPTGAWRTYEGNSDRISCQ